MREVKKAAITSTCIMIFCIGVSPSLRFFFTFIKSSTKPIKPNSTAIITADIAFINCCEPVASSFIAPLAQSIAIPAANDMITPAMNITPPIVGVPFFDLCHAGPISSMV